VSLKLRLNLIITGLLMLIVLAGTVLTLINARQNVRAEVASAERLALYLFDTALFNNSALVLRNDEGRPFQLQRLDHMRHLHIEFRDLQGRVLDSNQPRSPRQVHSEAPDWFEALLNRITPPWESQIRHVEYRGQPIGQLVITPDPTYEYAEIWKQITDSTTLAIIFFVSVNLMIAWAVSQALKPTENILQALNELERGNLKARLPGFDLPELSRIGEKFNRMVETLELSISRNHRLTQQLITLQEEERKSLARDLHDEFGQCLTAIHTDATVVLRQAETKYPEIKDSAAAISQLSRHLMDLVSGLLQRLRPGILDELGLEAALHDLVDTWQSRNDNAVIKFSSHGIPPAIAEAPEITAYRLVQECLTNITRHAEARHVAVAVEREIRNDSIGLHISVCDNGKGFDPSRTEGMGLPGMRERVEGLGGEWVVDSRLGQGTEIRAWIPVRDEA
jgi:two-component system sensor histidine kinase UhpB